MHLPGDPGTTSPARRGTCRSTIVPGRRRLPGLPRRGRRGAPRRGRGRARGRPAGHRPRRAAAAGPARRRGAAAHRGHRRAVDRRGPADRPGRRRRALGRPRRRRRHRRAWPACTRRRPDVGVVGYSIGGGIGWYARRLGLQCNAVTAVEVVLADGTFVRATADSDAELFWGLRGSGVPLGVVTALEFELLPHRQRRRRASWPGTGPQVERVLPRWAAWCADGPGRGDDVVPRCCTSRRSRRCPAELRGRRLVVIDGAVLGPDEPGRRDPRAAARPAPRSSTR